MVKKIMVWTVLSVVILLVLNNFSRGAETMEFSIEESKALLNAYYITGKQYFEDGNFHEAKQEFNKVLEIEPGHPGAGEYIELIDRIEAEMANKNPHLLEEAKDKEKEIVHAKRKSFKEYYEHGLKYYQKAEYGKAIAAFSQALQIKPDDKAVRKYLDKCFSKLDTVSKDKPVNVSESTHDDSKKLYTQAKQLVKDNKFKEAIEILTQYTEKHPQDQNARNLLHDTQMKMLSLEQKEIESKDRYQRQSRLLEVEQATIPTVEEKKAMITDGEKLETGVIKIGKEEKEAIKEIEQKTQQLVSLDFKDTDLREVIKYLVELTDVNIVLDEKVFDNSMSGQPRSEADRRGHGPDTEGVDSSGPITPEVTIFVKDIPLIRALDIILRCIKSTGKFRNEDS